MSTVLTQSSAQENSWIRNAAAVVGGSILLGLLAHAAIPLPFTPVPIVLQVQAALFLGASLGSRKGALAVLLFLLQGAMGFPVFSFGQSGIAYLLGPKGGYLMGYAAGAFLTGYLIERMRNRSSLKTFLAMAAGNGAVYVLGVAQLSLYLGLSKAVLFGMVPFVIGDTVKLLLASSILKRARSFQ